MTLSGTALRYIFDYRLCKSEFNKTLGMRFAWKRPSIYYRNIYRAVILFLVSMERYVLVWSCRLVDITSCSLHVRSIVRHNRLIGCTAFVLLLIKPVSISIEWKLKVWRNPIRLEGNVVEVDELSKNSKWRSDIQILCLRKEICAVCVGVGNISLEMQYSQFVYANFFTSQYNTIGTNHENL